MDFDGTQNLNLILLSCWVSSTDHSDGDPDAIYLIENRFVKYIFTLYQHGKHGSELVRKTEPFDSFFWL